MFPVRLFPRLLFPQRLFPDVSKNVGIGTLVIVSAIDGDPAALQLTIAGGAGTRNLD